MLQHSKMHYFCHTSNSMRYINPLNRVRLFSHRPASALTTPLQDWSPPSPLLLLLDGPCPVDRRCSCTALLVSTKRTAALPWRSPDHCSRTFSPTHCQCRRNILVAIIIYIATFPLPESLHYSGRAIQVHPKNVLSKCTVKLVLQPAHC